MRDFTALEARRVLDGDGHSEGEDDSTENSASKLPSSSLAGTQRPCGEPGGALFETI